MFVLTILRNNLNWRALHFSQRSLVTGVLGIVFTASVLLGTSTGGRADLDSALRGAGWSEFTFDDKAANHFTRLPDQPDVIQIDTDTSVSIAYLAFDDQPVNLTRTPYLTFSWRRLGLAVDTDLTRKGGDDRIAAVYVAFPYQPERASFKERLLRPFVEASEGDTAPGRVLTYLWGGGKRPGIWFENPYTGPAGWMQILQPPSAPDQQWFSHQLDIRADFMDRFGYAPPSPSYIAIAADSDDTRTRFSAQIKALGFSQ